MIVELVTRLLQGLGSAWDALVVASAVSLGVLGTGAEMHIGMEACVGFKSDDVPREVLAAIQAANVDVVPHMLAVFVTLVAGTGFRAGFRFGRIPMEPQDTPLG